MLGKDGTKLTVSVAGVNGMKHTKTEKVSVKVSANNHDEIVTFHVHPKMYLGSRRYDFSQINQKYKPFKDLLKIFVDLHDVKVVRQQHFFHLLFSIGHKKQTLGRKNKFGLHA